MQGARNETRKKGERRGLAASLRRRGHGKDRGDSRGVMSVRVESPQSLRSGGPLGLRNVSLEDLLQLVEECRTLHGFPPRLRFRQDNGLSLNHAVAVIVDAHPEHFVE